MTFTCSSDLYGSRASLARAISRNPSAVWLRKSDGRRVEAGTLVDFLRFDDSIIVRPRGPHPRWTAKVSRHGRGLNATYKVTKP